MLSGVIYHFLEKKDILIGKGDAVDIGLSGLSIRKEHAQVHVKGKEVKIKPATSVAKTKINGQPLTGEVKLMHNDRVRFGSNHMYVFKNPKNTKMNQGSTETITWEFAQDELAKAKGETMAGVRGAPGSLAHRYLGTDG